MRITATSQSTVAQNGGHQRVLATKWLRSCQASLMPWPAYATTRSQAVEVTDAAAITTKTAAMVTSTAMTLRGHDTRHLQPRHHRATRRRRGEGRRPHLRGLNGRSFAV